MNYAKKALTILLALALGLLMLAACGDKEKEEFKDNEKAVYLVMDIGWGDGPEEYPYDGEATVESLAAGLSEKTGLAFAVTSQDDGGALSVDWSANSSLLDGNAGEPVEGLVFYDYDGLAWFMLDSLYRTIVRNLPAMEEKVFYTMDGGKALALDISYPPSFTLDTPYMGSEFYLAHADGRGDDVIPDPSDVNWWGEYGSEAGMLNIVNYNDRGMGWSFRFVLTGDFDEEGVAAVDPDDPRLANFAQYDFLFNMDDETILLTVGSVEMLYMRTDDAVG